MQAGWQWCARRGTLLCTALPSLPARPSPPAACCTRDPPRMSRQPPTHRLAGLAHPAVLVDMLQGGHLCSALALQPVVCLVSGVGVLVGLHRLDCPGSGCL